MGMSKPTEVEMVVSFENREHRSAPGITHPDQAWVTQQARHLTWTLQDRFPEVQPMKCLIHDRDTRFSRAFNRIFLSEGIEIFLTPYRAPKANAFAERWIRSLREECLDHLLVVNERCLLAW